MDSWDRNKILKELKKYSYREKLKNDNGLLYDRVKRKDKKLFDIAYGRVNRKENRTEQEVIVELKKYKSRQHLKKENLAIHSWIIRHKKQNLFEQYLPTTYPVWAEKKVIELMKTCRTRKEFRSYSGARDWVKRNKAHHLYDEYIPTKEKITMKYIKEEIFNKLKE